MIFEYDRLKTLLGHIDRSPLQKNQFYKSDCEIISIGDACLAVTIDSVVEELLAGIYKEPYEIGYVAAISSISDLVATGAKPLGLVSTVEIPKNYMDASSLIKGINDACGKNQTYLLGGDTNFSDRLSVAVAGMGIIDKEAAVSRVGAQPGDRLFITGKVGHGNAIAVNRLILDGKYQNGLMDPDLIGLSEIISNYASAAIDTSDGLFASLSILGELNKVGFDLSVLVDDLIDSTSSEIIDVAGLPSWYLMAGPVGEYVVLFSVRPGLVDKLTKTISSKNLDIIEIGSVVGGYLSSSTAMIDGVQVYISDINNQLQQCNGNIGEIIKKLNDYEIEWSK